MKKQQAITFVFSLLILFVLTLLLSTQLQQTIIHYKSTSRFVESQTTFYRLETVLNRIKHDINADNVCQQQHCEYQITPLTSDTMSRVFKVTIQDIDRTKQAIQATYQIDGNVVKRLSWLSL